MARTDKNGLGIEGHILPASRGAMASRESRVTFSGRRIALYGHKAAVDRQIDSSDIAALVRSQEHRRGSNLLRFPDAPHRNHRLEPFLHRIRVLAKLTFENRCFDRARADHIRADSFA